MNRLLIAVALWTAAAARADVTLVTPAGAAAQETLAARELRRYLYLCTGRLTPITTGQAPPAGDLIVVARKERPLLAAYGDAALQAAAAALGPEQYLAQTCAAGAGRRVLVVAGGDNAGTLYGAYRVCEKLGVRFYLHADVIPQPQIPWAVPEMQEIGRPLFSIRGINPFHDFAEGPDGWSTDDYLAYIGQLAKLRMNFIGLHCYPPGSVGPEPAIWIGPPADLADGGRVKAAYPAAWASTARDGPWGYRAMKTGDFAGGAAQLFPEDDYGPEAMAGMLPRPATPEQCNLLFERTGAMYCKAFGYARLLGVKTCLGTETPLAVPAEVAGRLKAAGRNPADPAVVRELYTGLFTRLARVCPVDYYWLWTPENWTWGGNNPRQFADTVRDIQAALAALDGLGRPFSLATCGWVLGPQHDRSALDAMLPKTVPMSCISRELGHAALEPGFANITGRPRWAIPWMENDPDIISCQPWVGRLRYDAADARRLGCTGLIGIHWRTQAMAQNIAALSAAAWDQPWAPPDFTAAAGGAGNVALSAAAPAVQKARTMPVADFYADFARAHFGAAVAKEAGRIMAGRDGLRWTDQPCLWTDGPGHINVLPAPWPEVKARSYAFIDELARLQPQVTGAANRERFDRWLAIYRQVAAMTELACLGGELDRAMAALQAEPDRAQRPALAERALQVRLATARQWSAMMSLLVATVASPGELGTICTLEQHNRLAGQFLRRHDDALAAALGRPLPPACVPGRDYTGPARIIVPTVRTHRAAGEALAIKVMLIDARPVRHAALYVRLMGRGAYTRRDIRHVGRAVYEARLPPAAEDVEYYLAAETADGRKLVWPATAPATGQTVIACGH